MQRLILAVIGVAVLFFGLSQCGSGYTTNTCTEDERHQRHHECYGKRPHAKVERTGMSVRVEGLLGAAIGLLLITAAVVNKKR